jgi:hypothetical protein
MALGKRVSKSGTLTHSGRPVMRTIWEDIWRTPSTHSLPCCSPKYRRAPWVEPERYDRWPGATGHPIGVPMTVRVASCSCGQLRAEVRGEPTGVSVCHCHACQRRTGSVFGAQAASPARPWPWRATARSSSGSGRRAEVQVHLLPAVRVDGLLRRGRGRTRDRHPRGGLRGLALPGPHDLRLRGSQALLGLRSRRCRALAQGPGLKRPHPRPKRAAREGAGWQGRARPDT